MTSIKKNYELFDSEEYNNWAFRSGLIYDEQYLYDKWISRIDKEKNIIDIGTGNGKVAFEIAKNGFTNVYGIDLSEKLIEKANEKAAKYNLNIKYNIMDATKLTYENNYFEVVIALQQIVCLIDNLEGRKRAISEFYRVLKPGGKLIISFLDFNGRFYNRLLSLISFLIKKLKQEDKYLSAQYLPWLKLNKKFNFNYLFKIQPYTYWFKHEEAIELLKQTGFNILEIKTSKMLLTKSENFEKGGMLYLVCEKK